MTKYAIIPSYRPDKRLLNILTDAVAAGFIPIVIDDGSGETYAKVFEDARESALVLAHEYNRGKGCALKTGFMYLLEGHMNESSIIVTLDADGQHRISDAVRLCEYAETHPETLILGSRRMNRDAPLRSRMGNGITRWVYRIISGRQIYDTQTGLRVFNSDLLPMMLDISGERYEYEINVLLELSRRNISIEEISIDTVYLDGNQSSHFHVMHDSLRIYREILRFSASSMICFILDYGLYSILLAALGRTMAVKTAISVANVTARVFSATLNYALNRRMVFHHSDKISRSAIRYALLAAGTLAVNTLILNILSLQANVNLYLAKICAEFLLWWLNWFVQRRYIFRRKNEE